MTSRSNRIDCPPMPHTSARRIGRVLKGMLARLAEWRERSDQRKTLAAMNDRIGISRSDAIRESSRPFWRA
jgi:uncharacterized protein YjiS (DUF1127 family)